MGIQRLQPVSGGIDLRKITPLGIGVEYFTGVGGSYSPGTDVVIDIQGEGFIDDCIYYFRNTDSYTRECGLYIEVDGIAIYHVRYDVPASNAGLFGFISRESVRLNPSGQPIAWILGPNSGGISYTLNNDITLPYTPYSSYTLSNAFKNAILSRPIYFKNRFLVKRLFKSSSGHFGYSIKGGLIL